LAGTQTGRRKEERERSAQYFHQTSAIGHAELVVAQNKTSATILHHKCRMNLNIRLEMIVTGNI
jgi:hypothetical protein